MQLKNGCFRNTTDSDESDMRFNYCAACIAYMLGDQPIFDVPAVVAYIRSCRGYDGGFAQVPGMESHGGSTLCALATLQLTVCTHYFSIAVLCHNVLKGQLDELTADEQQAAQHWLVNRQAGGMQGRPNKPEDTCYAYWVTASLAILGAHQLIDEACERTYVLSTQHGVVGGMAKWPHHHPGL